jgi:hypothetical protein
MKFSRLDYPAVNAFPAAAVTQLPLILPDLADHLSHRCAYLLVLPQAPCLGHGMMLATFQRHAVGMHEDAAYTSHVSCF